MDIIRAGVHQLLFFIKIKNLHKNIAQVKGFYVHLRKGINEHMWGFIKTVNKIINSSMGIVFNFTWYVKIKYYIIIIVYLVKKSNSLGKKIENYNLLEKYQLLS